MKSSSGNQKPIKTSTIATLGVNSSADPDRLRNLDCRVTKCGGDLDDVPEGVLKEPNVYLAKRIEDFSPSP